MYLLKASWELSFKCNANCIHCYLGGGKPSNELTRKECDLIFDKLVASGIEELSLTGGEPLLTENWKHLAERARQKNIGVTLVTNGFCLDEKVIGILNNHKILLSLSFHAGSEQVFSSIYQASANNFYNLINSLKKLHAFTLNTVLLKNNYSDMDNILKLALENNCKRWDVFRLMKINRGCKENIELTDQEMLEMKRYLDLKAAQTGLDIVVYLDKKKPCALTSNEQSLLINPDGSIRPCYALTNHKTEGSLIDSELDDLLDSPQFRIWKNCLNCRLDCSKYCKAELLEQGERIEDFCPKINPGLLLDKSMRLSQGVRTKKFGGTYRIYNKSNGKAIMLNSDAYAILQNDGRSVKEILRDMQNGADLTETELQDAVKLVETLKYEGYIQLY